MKNAIASITGFVIAFFVFPWMLYILFYWNKHESEALCTYEELEYA
jgi:hypothetical protein